MCKGIIQERQEISAEGIPLNDKQVIQDLDQAETYKYMGMEEQRWGQTQQNEGQDHEGV